MRVAIMGTGATALLFGSRMMLAKNDILFVSEWKEQVAAINRNGLTLISEGEDSVTLKAKAVSSKSEEVLNPVVYPDLILVACKGYATRGRIKSAKPLIGPKTRVLTLQNGMGNADIIAEYVPVERIYFGAASVGAEIPKLSVVSDSTNHNRSPLIAIVPFSRKEDSFCKELENLFSSIGLPTDASPAAEKFIWKKLCVNSCGNAISAITSLSNHIYSNDQDGSLLLDEISKECCEVAKASGVFFDYSEIRAFVQKTFSNQHHHPSMYKDLQDCRPTEIDSINGFIVNEGKRHGIPTPVNETLVHIVRLISNHYAERNI